MTKTVSIVNEKCYDQNLSQKFDVGLVGWKSGLRKVDPSTKNLQEPKLPKMIAHSLQAQ